jgi:hypothetical protein
MNTTSKARLRQALDIIESASQVNADLVDALDKVSKLTSEEIDNLLRSEGIDVARLRHLISAPAQTGRIGAREGVKAENISNRSSLSGEHPIRSRSGFGRPRLAPRTTHTINAGLHLKAAAASGLTPFQVINSRQGSVAFFEVGHSVCVKFNPDMTPTAIRLGSVDHSIVAPQDEVARKSGLLEVSKLSRRQLTDLAAWYKRNMRKFPITWK